MRKIIERPCSGYLWCSVDSGEHADIKIIAIRHLDCNVLGLNCRLYTKIAILSEIFKFRKYAKMNVFRFGTFLVKSVWKVNFLNSTISMFWRWWCSTFSKNVFKDSKYVIEVPKTSLNTYNLIREHLEVIWKNHIKLHFLIIFRAEAL